jgi:DNA replication and repair protein RecF
MALSRLTLTDFRNHSAWSHSPGPGFVVLHGANGAGKTNILEAISLLVPGRGLRRAALSEIARHGGTGGFTVMAELDENSIGTGVEPTAPDRRKVRINGANSTINGLAEYLSVIWLTPAMDRLFSDGAGARRRFLDRLVLAVEPGHAVISSRYEKAVQQRNRLLVGEGSPDPLWLDGLEAAMAQAGAALIAGRARMIDALTRILNDAEIGPFALPAITLAMDGPMTQEQLQANWAQSRRRDAGAGRTLSGPHRADMIVQHRASGAPAALCSTGEQKALLLSLILAHAELVTTQRGAPPIMLLDEITAHLDPVRRAALFERLGQTGAQVWMTGTEPGLFEGIEGTADLVAVG